ncbi:uncharacterized protein LOC132201305 [Neocloeon triangulifer]|uniref:uncharacterized protein LOC132201305 n=1 Tax=Neocloeon triangulifer TaxID=2078957 RepID=UPI00286EEA37|nr:uncharacterized protein LOC132201305 [Neocloeon triangulifer]
MNGPQPASIRALPLPRVVPGLVLTLAVLLLMVGSSLAATTAAPKAIGPFANYLPWRRSDKTSWFKGWSGLQMPEGPNGDKTELTVVYVHEETLAVVELGKGRTLRNCELIELYEPNDLNLAQSMMRNVSKVKRAIEINFEEMMGLMDSCHQLTTPTLEQQPEARQISRNARRVPRNLLTNAFSNPVAIFSGIVPGTKWCGTGDIAATYYDLGFETDLDRCCRAHDLCPIKLRSYQTKYTITNNSIYSKSHCDCDSAFFRCLKDLNSSTADVMGNIYFNIVQVPCVEHSEDPKREAKPDKPVVMQFSKQQLAY